MSVDPINTTHDMMLEDECLPPLGGMLKVGDLFPEFSVPAVRVFESEEAVQEIAKNFNAPGMFQKAFIEVSSTDFPDKWLVIFGWPIDRTPVCHSEIQEFIRLNGEFQDRDAQILGLSLDHEVSHFFWRAEDEQLKGMPFPMLSDRRRTITEQAGFIDHNEGLAQRGTFIVDPDGFVRFSMMTDGKVGRNPKEILRILDALQTGGRCPCDWQPGDPTI